MRIHFTHIAILILCALLSACATIVEYPLQPDEQAIGTIRKDNIRVASRNMTGEEISKTIRMELVKEVNLQFPNRVVDVRDVTRKPLKTEQLVDQDSWIVNSYFSAQGTIISLDGNTTQITPQTKRAEKPNYADSRKATTGEMREFEASLVNVIIPEPTLEPPAPPEEESPPTTKEQIEPIEDDLE